MFHIEAEQFGLRIPATEGTLLLDCLRHAGFEVVTPCGGKGRCKQCTVHVKGAHDGPAFKVLACETRITRDLSVVIPEKTLLARQPVMLSSDMEAHPEDGDRGSGPAGPDEMRLGMAVDIGTTTIAGYLLDLRTGVTLGAAGMVNPQVMYGSEIITRLEQALVSPANALLLQEKITDALETLVRKLCEASGEHAPGRLKEIVAVGNTAMHHMLLNADIRKLARAPFSPSVSGDVVLQASETGMTLCADARIVLPAVLAGFVGSDHLAALYAIGACNMKGPVLVLDIGTNTEISLVAGDAVSCVSCASGSAFEGMNISCGMTAAEGAIDHVSIEGDQVTCHTIGDGAPVGICGSGIFDALAQMVLGGVTDRSGRIQDTHPLVKRGPDGLECILAGDGGNGTKISVTQADVRALQLAKAAISTGMRTLLQENGLEGNEVEEIVIAGGFGNYLDVNSAIAIGMFPDLPAERFRQVGNAAGAGARQYLRSKDARLQWQRLKDKVRYIELVKKPGFRKMFLSELSLGFWA